MIYAIAAAFIIGISAVIYGWMTNDEKAWTISRIFGGAFIVLLIIQIIMS
jgi:hypothetical protein